MLDTWASVDALRAVSWLGFGLIIGDHAGGRPVLVELETLDALITVVIEDSQFRILHDGTQLAACPRTVIKEVTRRSTSGHPGYRDRGSQS
jgi:hypothetical protein